MPYINDECLKIYGAKLFTCGFNDTEIVKQANNSICCQVKLSPETEDNTPNITEVRKANTM